MIPYAHENVPNFSSKSGKANAAIASIERGVNVLEENVAEDPKFCIVVSLSARKVSGANSPPVRAASEAAPPRQVLGPRGTDPRLNEAGEISTFLPPTVMTMVALQSHGTEIRKSMRPAADGQHSRTY